MKTDKDWKAEAKGVIKAELSRRGITHEKLTEMLFAIGVKETKASVDSKMSRGTFSAVFLIQCMTAIGCDTVRF